MFMEEKVVLVNEKDEILGLMEKMQAHENGILHRAFSVFLFNSKGEMLLQKRAAEKYHSPNQWTNACCSHPRVDETYEQAAHRRIKEELGIGCHLEEKFWFIYKADVGQNLWEHELDHVFVGNYEADFHLNPEEVAEVRYISMQDLDEEMRTHPEHFTEWFKIILEEYLMSEGLKIAFELLGGLALFIYSMNMMSQGLQNMAGEKMRYVLSVLTKNPVVGVLAGALVTCVLQSSSATTVMAIGFVSAGLMRLPQAISIIFGANIGTTMTAQLIAFKLSDYIWPIVFIGFMVYFFAKSDKLKNIGQTVFFFGLLFAGIEIMGSTMKPLVNAPIFTELIASVHDNPILGLLLGTVMTVIVQSSSATIAVLQNFAAQAGVDGNSIIGLQGALPILLGDNIGTTITALLASIGQSKNAKRTAVAHSVFNITGSIVFLCVLPLFAQFVMYISPVGPETAVISRQIANAHTSFNLINTLLWLPLIPIMVKIVCFIVPDRKPALSTEQVKSEAV